MIIWLVVPVIRLALSFVPGCGWPHTTGEPSAALRGTRTSPARGPRPRIPYLHGRCSLCSSYCVPPILKSQKLQLTYQLPITLFPYRRPQIGLTTTFWNTLLWQNKPKPEKKVNYRHNICKAQFCIISLKILWVARNCLALINQGTVSCTPTLLYWLWSWPDSSICHEFFFHIKYSAKFIFR